ncbi:aldo/keto reductase [Mastigocladopsis repens]|uniref:aldo/keto reductase n=1 Tax=Mastigocladopsis repens TaxID=221287 RepID=UPI0002F4C865|nr:aldo/keto reductase [Mastigocladopsis repens]
MAAQKQCTPAQLAIFWLLAQGNDIIPIPDTKRQTYLEENIGAWDVQLSVDELAQIDAIMLQGIAAGSRYPTSLMQMVNL